MASTATVDSWTTEDVKEWLKCNDLGDYCSNFEENEIDGDTLFGLNDAMIKELLPGIKIRVKFLRALNKLRESSKGQGIMPSTSGPVSQETSNLDVSTVPDTGTPLAASPDLANFRLPTFPPTVRTALEKMDKSAFLPGRTARIRLIEVLFNQIVSMNIWFPSRRGYNVVCEELKKKFSWLPGGPNAWKEALKGKFKRERMPLVNESSIKEMKAKFGRPGVSGRKRRRLEDEEEETLNKKDRSQLEIDDGGCIEEAETEVTINRHIEWLRKEGRKDEVDKDGVNHRLQKTKKQRKQYIKSSSIKDALEKFPILRHRQYILGEVYMQYAINVTNKMEHIVSAMELLEKAVKGRKVQQWETYYSKREDALAATRDLNKDIDLMYCCQLLPLIFGESALYMTVPAAQDIKTPSPVIVGNHTDGFRLFIEEENILRKPCFKFRLTLEAWFCSFWVFDLSYPKQLSKTMSFLEFCVVGCSSTAPKSVLSWAERLGMKS